MRPGVLLGAQSTYQELIFDATGSPQSQSPRQRSRICSLCLHGTDPQSLKDSDKVAPELPEDADASCQESVLDLYRPHNTASRDRLINRLLSYVYINRESAIDSTLLVIENGNCKPSRLLYMRSSHLPLRMRGYLKSCLI